MRKPDKLPVKTSAYWDYLVKNGWRYIGKKSAQYGTHYYWDYHIGEEDGCWSKQYIMGDALGLQKKWDKRLRAEDKTHG